MKIIKFTRNELHELVWRLPIHSIAKQLDVSGHEIRKVCKIYDIPVPIWGYWRKKKRGKKMNVSLLNVNYAGENEIFLRGGKEVNLGDLK